MIEAMKEMPNIEGRIALHLGLAGNVVTRVDIRSSRAVGACSVLDGRDVDEALRLLPALFAICGTAQTHAGLTACEDAFGVEPTMAQRTARRLMLLAETAREHCWRVCLDWPKHVGKPPDAGSLAALRAPLAGITAALFPGGDWMRPGGARIAADIGTLEEAVGSFSVRVNR